MRKEPFSILFCVFIISAIMSVTAMAKVFINKASDSKLGKLEGVGPNKCSEIIECRDTEGPFWNIEELKRVKGIGPTWIERNRKNIIITPELKCWNCGMVIKVEWGSKKGVCPFCSKKWPKPVNTN